MEDRNSSPETERKIFLPTNVGLTIFFSRHDRVSDLGEPAEFIRKVRSYDVFVPEIKGWTQETLDTLHKMSSGDKFIGAQIESRRKELHSGSYTPEREMDLLRWDSIYDSGIKIVIADIPTGTLSKEVDEGWALYRDDFIRPKFQETLDVLDRTLKKKSVLTAKRENAILSNLGPSLLQVTEADDFRDKPIVKVFMMLGLQHTYVYDVLKSLVGSDTTRTPYVTAEFGPTVEDANFAFIELENAYKEGKNIPLPEKERLLMEHFAELIIRSVTENKINSIMVHKFVRSLSNGEIKQLYTTMDKDTGDIKKSSKVWQKIFTSFGYKV